MGNASIKVAEDNGYHDSTIKEHCPLDDYPSSQIWLYKHVCAVLIMVPCSVFQGKQFSQSYNTANSWLTPRLCSTSIALIARNFRMTDVIHEFASFARVVLNQSLTSD